MSEHKNNENEAPQDGHIENMGMLDLRSAKTPEDLSYIKRIMNVGTILIPEHLSGVLAKVPMKNVGSTVAVPDGQNIKMQIGQIRLGGDAFVNGDPDTILFIVGQLFITTPVPSVGYKEVWVHGQVFGIRGSENTFGAKLGRAEGQVLYLPAEARVIQGSETIDNEYLEMLPKPCALVVMGELHFAEDVTKDLLKSKILEIVLMGVITAPQAILSLVKVLTAERMGEIISTEERARRKAQEDDNDESDD